MLIKIEHLKKEYEEATPLTDVCCEINKGDVISIIGPSGTGKSTLLNCINRLETPTSGDIFFDGKNITDRRADLSALRKKVGMVFQSFNLFNHLTVVENIMLSPMELLGMSKQKAYDKAMNLLSSVGLKDKAYAYPFELSGGQQQRVAIVRAVAMDPEVLLLDEPTSALDPTMVGEVLAVIRNLAQKGLTMMIVTHEMKFARDVSNRVFYMDQGIIYEDGSPEQIFENPKKELTRRFIKKLKVFHSHIDSTSFDFIGFNSSIEEYGRRHLIPPRTVEKMYAVAEELCFQLIIPRLGIGNGVDVMFEYSEDTGKVDMTVKYQGGRYNPLETEPIPVSKHNRNAVVLTDTALLTDADRLADAALHTDAAFLTDAALHTDAALLADAALHTDAALLTDADQADEMDEPGLDEPEMDELAISMAADREGAALSMIIVRKNVDEISYRYEDGNIIEACLS